MASLREQIANAGATAYFNTWEKLQEPERDNWRQWAKTKIIPLFLERVKGREMRNSLIKLLALHEARIGDGERETNCERQMIVKETERVKAAGESIQAVIRIVSDEAKK